MLPPIDATQLAIGDQPQLFVDSLLIEATQGLTRRFHQPQRRQEQPVIKADRPWESTLYFTYSNYCVIHDPADGLTKCWYEDLGPLKPGSGHPVATRLLYAQSEDGIHFEKPELDVCAIDGRRTNIVMGYAQGAPASDLNPWAQIGVHSNGIVLDQHPVRPEERFRTIFTRMIVNKDSGHEHGIQCAHSPDGIHWTPYPWKPVLGSSGSRLSDVSCLYYDPDARQFVQHTRHGMQYQVGLPSWTPRVSRWCHPYFPHQPTLMNKRRVFQTRSHDFQHWSDPIVVSAPDDNLDNLDDFHYGMGHFRMGPHRFGTLGIFQYVDNRMHVRLLHSRDGVRFVPANLTTPFYASRGEGFWDAHMVSMTSAPIERGDEWWFYHGGTTSHHDWWMDPTAAIDEPEAKDPQAHVKFALGLAVLRKGGIASLDASRQRDGYLITRPVRSEGDRLIINARCRPGGWIKAALLNTDSQLLDGRSLEDADVFTGDAVEHTFTWRGHDRTDNLPIWRRIHFLMRDAEIFGFRFAASTD